MSEVSLREQILWYLNGAGEDDYGDSVYFYSGMVKRFGVTKYALQKEMKKLREEGLVEHVRGLISEDSGGYYGSGFMLTAEGNRRAPKIEPK